MLPRNAMSLMYLPKRCELAALRIILLLVIANLNFLTNIGAAKVRIHKEYADIQYIIYAGTLSVFPMAKTTKSEANDMVLNGNKIHLGG